VSANRFAQPGFDLWVKHEQHDEIARALATAVPLCDRACAEVFRIEQGIPGWGRELTEEIIPIEANLEDSCIDYEKGCYIGQEVISRMKMSGQRNKSLCGLIAADDVPLIAGGKLFRADDGKKEVGWITSATCSDRLGKHIALGYVKRPFNQSGGEVVTEVGQNQTVRVRITDLPFGPLPS
jgi:folate-binding protein YgfZ